MKNQKWIYRAIVILFLQMAFLASWAQQNDRIPLRYNSDGSVTFSYYNPEARKVKLHCDCSTRRVQSVVKRESMHSVRMRRGADGYWEYTTPPLAPEIYTYQYSTKGKPFPDPWNADSVRILTSKRTVFVVQGAPHVDLCVCDSLCGHLDTLTYLSSADNVRRSVVVYTPPSYEISDTEFPVLFLLHGINGNENAWMDRGRAVCMLDNLIRQQRAVPMVLVMPDATPNCMVDKKYQLSMLRNLLHYRSWDKMEFERSFPDLNSTLKAKYRISDDADLRAVAGLSAGAKQSANLKRMYDTSFTVVGLFSPVVHRRQLPVSHKVYYWVGSGKVDIFQPQANWFCHRLQRRQLPFTRCSTVGGHTWRNWRYYFYEFTQTLFRKSPAKQ